MGKRKAFLLLIIILFIGGFFRFYKITEIPPGLYPDEAMNGNNALEALATKDFKIFYPENNGREGLFINLQVASLKIFGNNPWALRGVSAAFGTLTILGIYLLASEFFVSRTIAVLSSFLLATGFWHLNFSRIGFRAIMVPFFASFGMYFLLKGLRRGKKLDLALAGIFIGLGFHTYIAFRFMPFVLAVPILWYLWQWRKLSAPNIVSPVKQCIPCGILLFLFVTFIAALPVGFYFLQHPQDFLGRSGQVSIFSSISPIAEFAKSNILTLGMFFARGDCNWRHNFACLPELNPLVALFFLIGIIASIRALFKKGGPRLPYYIVFAWFIFMTLPATLTAEGLPHALRSIGMIIPSMIFAGLGAKQIGEFALNWFENQKTKWPEYLRQIERIKRELVLLFILTLLIIPIATYRNYFIRWANNPNTYFSFATDTFHLSQFLNDLPADAKKYVIVNLPGTEVRGIPMSAQTVMFVTDTFREEKRVMKNIQYILPANLDKITIAPDQKTIIAPLNGADKQLISALKNKFPGLKTKVPGDFVILQN